eukprot:GHUV01025762.1.p1 GENE.GHUV01025762.1~~GHUV01025762.1.p1  ORF type:complete len:134 (-),score=32.28 GHUV01025762.1:770-1171(-)
MKDVNLGYKYATAPKTKSIGDVHRPSAYQYVVGGTKHPHHKPAQHAHLIATQFQCHLPTQVMPAPTVQRPQPESDAPILQWGIHRVNNMNMPGSISEAAMQDTFLCRHQCGDISRTAAAQHNSVLTAAGYMGD